MGIIGNNDLQRFNVGVGGKAQVSDKFTLSASINYSTRKIKFIDTREIFRRIYYQPRNIENVNVTLGMLSNIKYVKLSPC